MVQSFCHFPDVGGWSGHRCGELRQVPHATRMEPSVAHQLALAVRIFSAAIRRKQAEAKMRTAHTELVLAQRRSIMGELVASLAHELNQPLGAILSNLGGLARLLARGNPSLRWPRRQSKTQSKTRNGRAKSSAGFARCLRATLLKRSQSISPNLSIKS